MSHDLFVYDTERLHSLTDADTVKQGLAYFSQNRVFALDMQDQLLTAQVEDAEFNQPFWVELRISPEQDLQARCDCGAETVCRHAVAALYSYASECADNDGKLLGSAVDEAILERIKKGRNEVNVKLLSGNLGFGIWQATSIISATHTKKSYQVQIRSLDQRLNYCTCPDLATNRLGTCKHIEAVLHYAKNKPDYAQLKAAGCPVSFVYLAWESATRPVLRLYQAAAMGADLALLLAQFFNRDGVFTGRLPEDFFRLSEQVLGRDDFFVGDDAAHYAHQLAEDAAHAVRATQISQSIMRTNGVLPGIKARLFPYQCEGVAFLASRGRALLADDMGLGKTLQALCAAVWLAEHAGVKKVLVVCPASLKHQWAREIEKFTAYNAQIIEGAAENRGVQYRADALFFIVNYELTVRDLSVISETLKPDLLILDEAQRIKNWRTKIASTIKLIPSRYVFVLSGTPLENRLEDLYSLLQVVDARVLGPLWRCLLEFHVTDERGKVIGYRNLSELRRRIAPVMLRRNRSLVSDQLPERTEVRMDIPLDKVQRELHDSALSAAGLIAQISKRRPLTPGEQHRLMSALQQARMACNAAGLVDKHSQGSPKLDELARLLEELCLQSNRKVVIFSQWELMTQMVETLVRDMGLGCVRLHGGVPSPKRGQLLDKFQQDAAVQVFIATDAGGVGLNLQNATVLINLDMPWNPAVLDQRIARIHRLGQKHNVQIFLLLAEDAYEQQVAKLVKGKRDLFDNVVSSEASEDVVGVSKKMLQTLVDNLAGDTDDTPPSTIPEPIAVQAQPAAASTAATTQPVSSDDHDADNAVRELLVGLQQVYGDRIVRIMGAGGGLLVLLSPYENRDEERVQQWANAPIPVEVIAASTWGRLQRLGAVTAEASTRVWFEPEQTATPTVNPLFAVAKAKLRSAEMLLEQQLSAGVMDLLAASLLAVAAAKAGLKQEPSRETAILWLYNEALPQLWLNTDQVAAIVRALSLSQHQDLPTALLEQVLADARLLCYSEGD